MNYIDIKEASKITGKNEKTIRRLVLKPDSKAYINKEGNKYFIDVNYLFSVYEPIQKDKTPTRQNIDISNKTSTNVHVQIKERELDELRSKIELYELQIQHNKEIFELKLNNKEVLLAEKESRIEDLQKTILLLNAPEETNKKKKKKFWFW